MPRSTRSTSDTRRSGSARALEILVRAAITVAVLGLLVLLLWASPYTWKFEEIWPYRQLLLEGVLRTLQATAVGFGLGLVLGLGVALARLSRRLWLRHLGDLYVLVIRGLPFLVLLLIAYYGIAPLLRIDDKFLVGGLTLAVFGAAYIGEIIRAGIESIDRGQFEAARSLGLNRRRTLRYVVLPQALRRMVPPLTGELIALTKESSLLFVIGFTELLYSARQAGADTYQTFEAYLVAAALYLVITVPLSLLTGALERRLGRGQELGVHL